MTMREQFPELASWRRDQRWRRLPYAKGVWEGPHGRTEYLCDRDYNIIAYRGADGRWMRGKGESLSGYAMINRAEYVWTPGRGSSPAANIQTLRDLVARCARHHSTAWIIEEASA